MPNTLTITLAFIGWLYLLFLNNRALKRSEIGRLKDDIIAQLLDGSEWLIKEVKDISKSNSGNDAIKNLVSVALNINRQKKLESEQIWTAKITQIELKSNLLNKLAKCELIDLKNLNALRDIDFIVTPPSRREIIELTSDFIENTETKYHDFFFNMDIFEALVTRHKYSTLGILCGFTILVLFYHTMDIFIMSHFY